VLFSLFAGCGEEGYREEVEYVRESTWIIMVVGDLGMSRHSAMERLVSP
jgi:hypothetical protein